MSLFWQHRGTPAFVKPNWTFIYQTSFDFAALTTVWVPSWIKDYLCLDVFLRCDESRRGAANLPPVSTGCSGHPGGLSAGRGEFMSACAHGLLRPRKLKKKKKKRTRSKPWAVMLLPAPGKPLVFGSGAHVPHVPRWQVQAGAGRGLPSPIAPKADTKLWLSGQTQLSSEASAGLAANPWSFCLLPEGFSSEGITRQGRRMAENVCLFLI